jgi:hypothetical protein
MVNQFSARGIMGGGQRTWPSLQPMSGLGSYGRTRSAILVGGPRSSIANQGRIYQFAKSKGKGDAYKFFLINSLGPGYVYKNALSVIQ